MNKQRKIDEWTDKEIENKMTIHKHSKSEKIRSNKQTEKINWHNYNHKPNKYNNNKQQQTPTAA